MTDRYARVYFDRIAKDAKFDGIRNDGPTMGSWVLLLIEAEKAWPAPAFPLPTTWVPAKHFRLFQERGIIDVESDGRFRVHGLDKERGSRSERGSAAAAARWSADRNAAGNASGIAARISDGNANAHAPVVSSSTPSLSGVGGPGEGADGREDLEAYLAVRFRPPTPAQRTLMDSYCQVFDKTGPARAARLIFSHPDDPIGALKADLASFRAERSEEARKAEAPKPAPSRGSETTLRYTHELGAHAAEPNPRCPLCREEAA